MKRLLFIAAMLVMSLCVNGGDEGLYFYWMVDQTDANPESFYYAMISITGEGVPDGAYLATDGYTLVFPSGETVVPGTQLGTMTEATYSSLASLAAEYDDLSALSFAVELYSVKRELIGVSEAVTYASLLNGGFIYKDMWTTTELPFVFVASVPEPSGGLLVLFGLGALALRRKREVEV